MANKTKKKKKEEKKNRKEKQQKRERRVNPLEVRTEIISPPAPQQLAVHGARARGKIGESSRGPKRGAIYRKGGKLGGGGQGARLRKGELSAGVECLTMEKRRAGKGRKIKKNQNN